MHVSFRSLAIPPSSCLPPQPSLSKTTPKTSDMCTQGHSHRASVDFWSGLDFLATNNTYFLFFWHNLFWEEIDDFYFQLALCIWMCAWVRARAHTHAHILVCQILLSMPGNMCSHRMERSHLHPPCIFSPGSKLLGNEFPKEKEREKHTYKSTPRTLAHMAIRGAPCSRL